MRSHSAAAATQALLLALASLTLFLAWRHAVNEPFDRQTLAIDAGQLQSHAAEAQLLVGRFAGMSELPKTFVRMHGKQLADHVRVVGNDLAARDAKDGVVAERRAAITDGIGLHATLERIADGADIGTERSGINELANRLTALHRQLDPSG